MKKESNLLLSIIDMLLYGEFSNKNLVEMYRIMGHERFILFCKMFSDRTINIPNFEKVKDSFFTASLYYYRYIELMEWKDIKKKLGVDFNTLKYETKLNSIIEFINEEISNERN